MTPQRDGPATHLTLKVQTEDHAPEQPLCQDDRHGPPIVFLVVRHVLRLIGPRSQTRRQRRRDRRPAPPVGSAAPPSRPPPLRTHRSPDARHVSQALAEGALVGPLGHAGNAVALASGARTTSMDLPSRARRQEASILASWSWSCGWHGKTPARLSAVSAPSSG